MNNLGDVKSYDARKSAQEFEEFTREYERQEQVKRDAALKPLTVLSADAAREKKLHDFDQECLWSAPLDTIRSILNVEKRRESMYWLLFFGNERTNQTAESTQKVFSDYIDKLPSRTGFKFSDPTRLVLMAKVQWFCGGVEISQETLDTMLDTLLKHSCFADDGEIEYDETLKTTPVAPVVPPNPTDSFEHLSLLSDEGARQGRAIAQELYGDELAVHTNAWRDHMRTVYGFNVPDSDIRYLCEWVVANNKSWLDPRTFDAFRLHAIRIGRWSPAEQFMSHEEIKSAAIEKCDMTDRDVRGIVLRGSREALLNLLQRKGVSLV